MNQKQDRVYVNETTSSLAPYPMEELRRIKNQRISEGKTVYDFGTGDPKIATWEEIPRALASSLPKVSQYPSIRGKKELLEAHWNYLGKRFGLNPNDNPMSILPTRGSKEAVFHLALSLIGRNNKKSLLFPNPGYPVYQSSALFAGGTPVPMTLSESNNYRLEPWSLEKSVQKDTAALWINYPHNPTGTDVDIPYWNKVIDWCQDQDVILLSDDCYVDIYDPDIPQGKKPISPLQLTQEGIVALFSLSKRSGLTGYRAGFLAGDPNILEPHCRARANFGLGNPEFVQDAAIVAWNDEEHVAERRKIFFERMKLMGATLKKLDLLDEIPETTFYIWARIPKKYGDDDQAFCKDLAELGIIASPSSWLGKGSKGFFRLAMVPELEEIREACKILEESQF